MDEYDGFLFLPSDQEDEETDAIDFRFLKFKQDMGAPIEGNEMGGRTTIPVNLSYTFQS